MKPGKYRTSTGVAVGRKVNRLRPGSPDVSVTEGFKQKEIKSFEDYMKLALNMLPAITPVA